MQNKILLIDDESSFRRTMSLSLTQRGYDTEPCENGVCGLKKMELLMKNNEAPAAVVIDIQLPDINGEKLAKTIKLKYPDIPIILITGYADKLNPEEIENLNVKTLLIKPFSADDLTAQFEEILKERITPKVEVSYEAQKAKSESAYALLKLEDNADFFETFRKLYYMDNILYCDATKGEYDIILLIQNDSLNELRDIGLNRILNVKGVKEVDFLEVREPVLDDSTNSAINAVEDAMSKTYNSNIAENKRDLANRVCSYVLVELEREKLDKIYPTLLLNENVVYCDYTTGKYNLVLMIYGNHFGQIDKIINEKIINLDGILKVKEYPIINIFEM